MSLAVTPDGTRAYVTNSGDDTVSVIDLATGTVVSTLAVGDGPAGIAITPDGRHAYVNNATARTISVLDLDTFPTITTTTLPSGIDGTGYTATVATTGAPTPQLTVTAGTLPAGLSLDPTTGTITGVPTVAGTYAFTITAASTVSGIPATATRNYTITIAAPAAASSGPADTQLPATGFDPTGTLGLAATILILGVLLQTASAILARRRTPIDHH
jgi:YVTN family beta-propeller protein